MNEKEKMVYSEEFKRHIVELYESGQTTTQLSKTYGMSTSSISGWIKLFGKSPEKISEREYARELKEKEKRIRELEIEAEILKKAMVIMLKTSVIEPSATLSPA